MDAKEASLSNNKIPMSYAEEMEYLSSGEAKPRGEKRRRKKVWVGWCDIELNIDNIYDSKNLGRWGIYPYFGIPKDIQKHCKKIRITVEEL